MHRLTKGYAAAVALSAVTLLGACTTPATDPPSTTSATSASATSTPATTPPSSGTTGTTGTTGTQATPSPGQSEIPAAARANTAQGAEAFTRHFLNEVNRGYNSMNPEPIMALSASNCQACGIMKTSIEEWRAKSYHYVGDFITPTVITVSAFPQDSTAKVLVASMTAESKLLSDTNAVVKTFTAENASSLVSVTYANGHWSAVEIKAAG